MRPSHYAKAAFNQELLSRSASRTACNLPYRSRLLITALAQAKAMARHTAMGTSTWA